MTSEQPTLTIFNESLTLHFLPPPVEMGSPNLGKQGIGELLPQPIAEARCSFAAMQRSICLGCDLSVTS